MKLSIFSGVLLAAFAGTAMGQMMQGATDDARGEDEDLVGCHCFIHQYFCLCRLVI